MYPIVTLILCMIFLKQELSLKQGLGMLFALAALILFSTE
jgi:transporter family protein